ncbi:helix-turn-helix domain-containing protein [Oceanobacillus halophilus]|uniref:Helix-turn-helix domain-containing protein n=1 Tax=Oceanobacillus halophilus TaxID=930130 RepID=A0A495ACK2_9BACI|nr:RodZ domain-containing protein [Oceanobacillus halophilus]RKQ37543.1 helix-turn-helix domain-containing protein [Oceanobacillus halophilus]
MDIGARLKEARVSKGLSLEELQEETKIQKRYLAAIEEGKLEILPGKFYARAFIKEYANAVGIDPSELLEEHKEEIPKNEDESEVQYSRMQRSRKDNSVEKSSKVFSVFPTIIVVLLIIGIFFVFWYFRDGLTNNGNEVQEEGLNDNEIIISNPDETNGGDDANTTGEETENEDESSDEQPSDEETVEEDTEEEQTQPEFTIVEEGTGSSPKSTLELNNVGEEIEVVFETAGETWLDVINDEGTSVISEKFVAENSPLEVDLSGTSEMFLNIGNAADLKITINGVEMEYPVDPEKFVHQGITINIKQANE